MTESGTTLLKSPARRDCSNQTKHGDPGSEPGKRCPCPEQSRPLHCATIHIIELSGVELLDVRIHTAHVDTPIARELLREKQTECRAYGQCQGYNIDRLDQCVIPVVLEQHGCPAPGAQAIFQDLIQHRTQLLVRQGLVAKRQASSKLWVPLACALLPAPNSWQSLAECLPMQQVAWPPISCSQLGLIFFFSGQAHRRHFFFSITVHPRGAGSTRHGLG